MLRRTTLLPVTVFVLFAACGTPVGRAEEPQDSGVAGTSVVDGGCPVVRIDKGCPDRPMPAHLTVTQGNSQEVVTVAETDPHAKFWIPLPPGSYTMTPANTAGSILPSSSPISFDVHEHEFTTVTVRFDSGVR
ncbi:MAG: hypothetical protein NVS4B6_30370 [Mycobacterium sp.]